MSRDCTFLVRLTADFFDGDKPRYADIGLSAFGPYPGITHTYFAEHHREIAPEQIAGAQGIIVLTPAVTRDTMTGAAETLAIGRFGVGYDAVDIAACTDADVAVFIAVGAVDRSVAEATLGWMFVLTHKVLLKDHLVRSGDWDSRAGHMGSELRNRTLGVIGCGGIARELIRLTRGLGMDQPLAFSPSLTPARARPIGARAVALDDLLRHSDFVSIHCPLKADTRGLIGKRELHLMKNTAYLLNTARGGIVEEHALFEVLKEKRIAGAALDCFAEEPVTKPHRFAELDNVVLAPHSIAWTHELFRDIGCAVTAGMIDVAHGRKPHGLINPEVYERVSFQRKLKTYGLGS